MGLHLLRRSYFLPLANKRRETVLFLPRKEGAYRTQRPSALESPLPLYTNQTFKRVVLFKATTATSACASPGLKNSPLYIQSLPEHCLSLKTIVTIFLSKRAFKTACSLHKIPSGGASSKKKKKGMILKISGPFWCNGPCGITSKVVPSV